MDVAFVRQRALGNAQAFGSQAAGALDLAEPFDMKLPSFVQHLSVLEKSELVTSTKQGRVRTYAIAPAHFQVAEDWLSQQRKLWEARFDRFDDYVLKLKDKQLKKKEETK